MRGLGLLFLLALLACPTCAFAGSVATQEKVLERAGLKTDADSLLAFFRKRTLADSDRPKIAELVKQLGSSNYRVREHAMTELVARGPVVNEFLRAALEASDLEIARRVERCLQRIAERDVPVNVPAAAVRVLADRKPKEAVEVIVAYLPFADNDAVIDESRELLAQLGMPEGKLHPSLVAALADAHPARRAAAGETLCKVTLKEQRPAIGKLLEDRDAQVRFRVARALVLASREKTPLPTLIASIPELPLNLAWQAEDFLLRVAAGQQPPTVALGNDPASRAKCRDAWQAWWKTKGDKVDLAKLEDVQKLLGYTLVVLLDQGRIVELDAENQPRWQLDNLVFPLDAQLIGDDRVLIAEYHANRVSERDLKGQIKWQKQIVGPLACQRLPNGSTFIATDSQLLEYDKDDKETVNITMPGEGRTIMKAMKLPSGEIAMLTADARVVRMDATGKELHSFQVNLGMRLFGGRIHMLPNGRTLVPHNMEDKVVEYDGNGKAVWEVNCDKPVAAVRLPNGNTIVTSMNPATGAVEYDRAGAEVWSYRSNTRVTRALRR
jgi:hypothetical protein